MKIRYKTCLALLAKSTKLVKCVKVFKALKAMKAMMSMGSLVLFAACQSVAMGIAFGIGLTLLLLIHELGHVFALKQKGHGIRLPFFIPFVGAAVFMERSKCRDEEAYIGIGGPLVGTAAALILALVAVATGSPVLKAIAYFGVFLNLFNMLPVSPLDGGRITQAVSKHVRYAGVILLFLLTMALKDPGLLLIWIIVAEDMPWPRIARAVVVDSMWLVLVGFWWFSTGTDAVRLGLDVILGLLFAVVSTGLAVEVYNGAKDPTADMDVRPVLPAKTRLHWAGRFVALAVVQIAALWAMSPELPKPVEEQPIDYASYTTVFAHMTFTSTNVCIITNNVWVYSCFFSNSTLTVGRGCTNILLENNMFYMRDTNSGGSAIMWVGK